MKNKNNIKFNHFSFKNKDKYNAFKSNHKKCLRKEELGCISRMDEGYEFVIITESILNINRIVGYCKIVNLKQVDDYFLDFLLGNQNIKKLISKDDSYFIEDFYILERFRNRGYGDVLVSYLLNEISTDKAVYLLADGDGVTFWPKYGFIQVNSEISTILYIKKGESK